MRNETNQKFFEKSCQDFLDKAFHGFTIESMEPRDFIDFLEVLKTYTEYDHETFYEVVEYLAPKISEFLSKEKQIEYEIEEEKESYIRDIVFGRGL